MPVKNPVDIVHLKPTEFDDEIEEDEHMIPEIHKPAHMAQNKLEVHVEKKKSVSVMYVCYWWS